jgi:hypothetical protein
MSFISSDLRGPILGSLDLANINTPDGDFGFMVGRDGNFTDMNGKTWYGSTLLSMPRLQSAIDGIAPSGSIALSFFQDPDLPDLIGQIRALGSAYIDGRPITFFYQPIRDMAEFWAPVVAPNLYLTRTMRGITYSASGAQDRSIELSFEASTQERKSRRAITLDTDGHAKLTGAANPSLSHMPTENFDDTPLFGA